MFKIILLNNILIEIVGSSMHDFADPWFFEIIMKIFLSFMILIVQYNK